LFATFHYSSRTEKNIVFNKKFKMKLSEISTGSCVAWSPIVKNSSVIACGTVAGILDTNFDTSAHLELYKLDLRNPKTEPKLIGSTTVNDRFSRVCWSSTGVQSSFPNGVIAGGLANGIVQIFDPSKIM
jgi:protein transport protein SEC31